MITTWLSDTSSLLTFSPNAPRSDPRCIARYRILRPVLNFSVYGLQASGHSMTELDAPLFIPPEDEGLIVQQDSEEGVAAAQLLHSPPRKRSRNVFEKPENMKIPQCQGLQIVRDEDYYFSDGSCIILVENTLFNVNTYFSSRESDTN
jgi:hypothetical protein